jgi:hypothetical protein
MKREFSLVGFGTCNASRQPCSAFDESDRMLSTATKSELEELTPSISEPSEQATGGLTYDNP